MTEEKEKFQINDKYEELIKSNDAFFYQLKNVKVLSRATLKRGFQ